MMAETIFAVALTVGAYVLSLRLRRLWQHPVTTPVFSTFVFVIAVLLITRMKYSAYQPGGAIISAWLAPATAALAVLIVKHRQILFSNMIAVTAALGCGFVASLVSAVLLAHVLALPATLFGILPLKSVTVAISSQLAPVAHVSTALVAVSVIAVGVIGAAIGPSVLTAVGVREHPSRGLALGAISHGIGTAQAATESETAAAASSLAMCMMALLMCTIGLPLVIAFGR
jgi:putative effector of murein hydrolase